MFEIIKSGTNIKFSRGFLFTGMTSLIIVLISLWALFAKLQYGVDFRGGAEVQVKFHQAVNVDNLRKVLKNAGLKGVSVQSIGEIQNNELLLKVAAQEGSLNEVTQHVSDTLNREYSKDGVEIRKVDIVGPKAGEQLRNSGFQAMLYALIAIMVYVGLRFDFKYSPGAIIALFHDVSIVVGIFAFTGTEFTLQTVAALLAVIGYSVNDTVIVYDRVREHEQKFPEKALSEHIDLAINETLSRTILTSGTTLFISVTMLFFGGLAIRDFFFAITLGVLVGTYSSIYIAAPVTLIFDRFYKGNKASEVAKASV